MFAALKSAVETDVDAFLRRGSVNAQDLETLLLTVHASRARHGAPGGRSGWGAALVAPDGAEVDALVGPGRAAVADFEAFEQAVRHQALDIAAQWMA